MSNTLITHNYFLVLTNPQLLGFHHINIAITLARLDTGFSPLNVGASSATARSCSALLNKSLLELGRELLVRPIRYFGSWVSCIAVVLNLIDDWNIEDIIHIASVAV